MTLTFSYRHAARVGAARETTNEMHSAMLKKKHRAHIDGVERQSRLGVRQRGAKKASTTFLLQPPCRRRRHRLLHRRSETANGVMTTSSLTFVSP